MISPFAVRFTQEHIRTTFRDGRCVEAAVSEIEETPGTGDYDVILRFPFPAIEIVRWHVPHHQHSPDPEPGADGDHWFTLDNRRLYCLQRAAAACWPRRAGVAVEILYASRGSVRRKCDTTTHGCSVTIAPSIRDAPVSRWDWRAEVQCPPSAADSSTTPAVRAALDAISSDDAKLTVHALSDLSQGPSSAVARALDLLAAETAIKEKELASGATNWSPTPSTGEPSDESDTGSGTTTPRSQTSSKLAHARSRGQRACTQDAAEEEEQHEETEGSTWNEYGGDAEVFAWWAIEEINRQLGTPGHNGYVWLAHWKETYAPHLGTLRTFLESRPDKFTVIPGNGRSFRVASALPVKASSYASRKSSWRQKATV